MKDGGVIRTMRLQIVPMNITYLDSTHEYASDPENTVYMLHLPNESLEATKQFILGAEAEWKKACPAFYEYAILMGEQDPKHVGAISLYLDIEHPSEAELGWLVNKRYWKQGIGSEAARALVEYAHASLGINRFIAHCDSENMASQGIMRNIGMHKVDEYGGRYNKQSEQERRECLYELVY